MSTGRPGWQQPEIKPLPRKQTCLHLGLVGATLALPRHNPGHEWVCGCGQKFVVVRAADGKSLKKVD